jgi:beta,beta-carotene 9',10'-dioxygenase
MLGLEVDLSIECLQVPLKIEGKIPEWLSGTLVRNGPVHVRLQGKTQAHWFDGLAMLHAFSFDEGKVQYTNKFLRTDAYKQVFEKGSLDYLGFAQDPCRSRFKSFFTWFFPKGHALQNANINVAKIADAYVALTEVPLPVQFDLETLKTLGVFVYDDALPKRNSWESAHPHLIEDETFNYLIKFGRKCEYLLYKISENSKKRELLAKVPVKEPSYMHSFSVTESFLILTEYPFTVRPLDMLLKGEPFIRNFSWKPEKGTQILVIDRHLGKVVDSYQTFAFFAFHHVNAFERDGKLVLDVVCYEDAEVIFGVQNHFKKDVSPAPEDFRIRLERFTIDEGKVFSETLLEGPFEFPRINPAFDGKPYRYVYLADPRHAISENDHRPVGKFDTHTKQMLTWSEKGCYPGEPVFVPDPEKKDEDVGVVLTVVLDFQKHTSFLLILDAQTFQELGRAQVTHAIPPGLHGQFF